MSKQSRLLGFMVLIAFAVILGTTIWKQHQIERTRVVRIEIIHEQMMFTTTPSTHQKWIWNGVQAQFISDHLKFNNAGCLGLATVNRLRSLDDISIKITRQADESTTYDFALQDGVTRPDKERCQRLLTPQSLKYFRDIIAQTPPNVK